MSILFQEFCTFLNLIVNISKSAMIKETNFVFYRFNNLPKPTISLQYSNQNNPQFFHKWENRGKPESEVWKTELNDGASVRKTAK